MMRLKHYSQAYIKKGHIPTQVFPVPNAYTNSFCCLPMHNMHIVCKLQLDLNMYRGVCIQVHLTFSLPENLAIFTYVY